MMKLFIITLLFLTTYAFNNFSELFSTLNTTLNETESISTNSINSTDLTCGENGDWVEKYNADGTTYLECECDSGYIHSKDDDDLENTDYCNYHQKSQLATFLLSFFLGEFGIDRFYLSRGNGWWIVMGILKLLTGGGLGLWWLIDWIIIAAGGMHDGNGEALKSW